MLRRGVIALGLAAVAVGVAGAASQPADGNGGAGARAYAIRLVLPNEAQPIVVAEATSPPNGTGFEQAYAYPADGSAVKTGALTTSASSSPGPTSSAQAASGVAALSLFNGELTADTVSGRARATATQKASSGDLATGTGFTNLTVLGEVLPQPTPNQRVTLADWGYAILLEQDRVAPVGERDALVRRRLRQDLAEHGQVREAGTRGEVAARGLLRRRRPRAAGDRVRRELAVEERECRDAARGLRARRRSRRRARARRQRAGLDGGAIGRVRVGLLEAGAVGRRGRLGHDDRLRLVREDEPDRIGAGARAAVSVRGLRGRARDADGHGGEPERDHPPSQHRARSVAERLSVSVGVGLREAAVAHARSEQRGKRGRDRHGRDQADRADERRDHLLRDGLAVDRVGERRAADREDEEHRQRCTGIREDERVHGGRDVVVADVERAAVQRPEAELRIRAAEGDHRRGLAHGQVHEHA